MATRMRLELTTSAVTGRRSNQLNYRAIYGNNRARTYDPLLVRQMLSQLSYAPISVVIAPTTIFIILHFKMNVNSFLKVFLMYFPLKKSMI